MKAIVMHDFGEEGTLSLEEKSTPTPQKKELRIRIKSVGFNPIDWKIRYGFFKGPRERILGCECSGIVDAIDENITKFNIGDEVYAITPFCCSNGSYAEFVSVPEELVCKKPKNLSWDEAASVPLAAMTAYRATLAAYNPEKSQSIFIAGAGGGVGMFATQLLQLHSKKKIFSLAHDPSSSQILEDILKIPKSRILIYKDLPSEEIKNKLLKMNDGCFFDSTFDFVGKEVKKLCLELTNFSGHFSTTLPEKEFEFPTWNYESTPFSRNLSIHLINLTSELEKDKNKNWNVYSNHLAALSNLFEKNLLKPLMVKNIGALSVSSVEKGHELLISKRVKGKLVMTVEK